MFFSRKINAQRREKVFSQGSPYFAEIRLSRCGLERINRDKRERHVLGDFSHLACFPTKCIPAKGKTKTDLQIFHYWRSDSTVVRLKSTIREVLLEVDIPTLHEAKLLSFQAMVRERWAQRTWTASSSLPTTGSPSKAELDDRGSRGWAALIRRQRPRVSGTHALGLMLIPTTSTMITSDQSYSGKKRSARTRVL